MSQKRAMVFVDGRNLYHGKPDGFEYDYFSIRDVLTEGLQCVRVLWFDAFDPSDRGEVDFVTRLRNTEFETQISPYRDRDQSHKCPECGHIHKFTKPTSKGADVGIAAKMVELSLNEAYDVAYLVSGDDDFTPAIRIVQNNGHEVVVAAWESRLSKRLKNVANDHIKLDSVKSRIEKDW